MSPQTYEDDSDRIARAVESVLDLSESNLTTGQVVNAKIFLGCLVETAMLVTVYCGLVRRKIARRSAEARLDIGSSVRAYIRDIQTAT